MVRNKNLQADQSKDQKSREQTDNKGKGKSKQDVYPVIPQKDLFQRINFTYQASIFLQSLGSGISASTSTHSNSGQGDVELKVDRKGKRKAIENEIPCSANSYDLEERLLNDGQDAEKGTTKKLRQLARMNVREMNSMSVHNQLKLDPSLKRSLCKTCGTILIPGLTSRIRNRPNRNSFSITHHTCLTCLSSLSIPSPPMPTYSIQDATQGVLGDEQLDGPVRQRRRRNASKRGKIVFHEKERSTIDGDGDGMGGGHTLWKGDDKLEGWGIKLIEAGNQ
ncbi:hypothetical protein V866_003747 [Kwoniella sp. B9012]|uniref:Uncharacterized protein n=1 Tax=Kwoniella europaea PYCC6329 TaxID=1423913 RepID=A0AAX4KIL9_9TREE